MRSLLLVVALVVSGCGAHPGRFPERADAGPCGCAADRALPSTGEATLHRHTQLENYLQAVVSFEWATQEDSGQVNNDWDMELTGDSKFRVNTVTDDRSCIEDLGAIQIVDVPEREPRCDDFLPVAQDHVYLVRTRDSNTASQFAAFGVTSIQSDGTVTIRWFRSPDPERFVLDL